MLLQGYYEVGDADRQQQCCGYHPESQQLTACETMHMPATKDESQAGDVDFRKLLQGCGSRIVSFSIIILNGTCQIWQLMHLQTFCGCGTILAGTPAPMPEGVAPVPGVSAAALLVLRKERC